MNPVPPRARRGRVVVGASLAQKPGRGGHTWVVLQLLIGLRRLGFEVLLLDRLDASMVPGHGGDVADALASGPQVHYALRVLSDFGLADSASILLEGSSNPVGWTRSQALEFVGSSDLFLNVMGFIDDSEIRAAAPRLAFLDIDPGFGQIWCDLGLHDPFAGHDRFATVGLSIGRPDCSIPTCGHTWVPTLPPVVLDLWPAVPIPQAPTFTTVGAWRGAMAPLEYEGRSLGLRVHEFRRFLELPRRVTTPFEVALQIHASDHADRAALLANGWVLLDPAEVAADPMTYRAFLGRSGAEFMVAKNLYVETASGWFSDRTACYLASGRPVLAQDTGLPAELETGSGLVLFGTLDEAAEGAERIASEWKRHGRRAREWAEAWLDSDRVLSRLVDALTGTPDPSPMSEGSGAHRLTAASPARCTG